MQITGVTTATILRGVEVHITTIILSHWCVILLNSESIPPTTVLYRVRPARSLPISRQGRQHDGEDLRLALPPRYLHDEAGDHCREDHYRREEAQHWWCTP